ncbi:DUF2067 domain-containing protein [Methanococcus voltae]|uniref:Uncharacterized protein n=2 Tax=Methanococcus voltae TaxID=2188 RepID=A0A8J7RNY8_METVO|nr:DUF2067 domain-containing protein [Methanococcus voltae]MBP2172474.1 hypothetical protein [Methanococcus voltae]MBP2201619.1 hypothetical protein [Methanococcus voltae]MCS3922408.1 hypothetical protein [Methanococcus voltae PS]
MKRVISVSGSEEETVEICEKVAKLGLECSFDSKVKSTDGSISSIMIKLYGNDRIKLKEDHKDILAIITDVKNKYNANKKGMFTYQLNDLKTPVNKDLIIDALKYSKIKCEYLKSENELLAEITAPELDDLLKELQEIYVDLSYYPIGSKPVKNAVVLGVYISGVEMEDILELGLEKGCFREEDDRIVLNMDINKVKTILCNELKN